ncbi:unnamed protein product [Ixodes hexagonus]
MGDQGEVSSTSGQDAPAEVVDQAARFNFAARLSSLPAVSTICDVASQSYARVKSSYVFVALPLRLIEHGVQVAGEKALPGLAKFGPQLGYVDGLACRGLDRLEAAYPDVTKKQPLEILNDTLAFGCSKLADVMDYGVSKAQDVKTVVAGALHASAHPVQTLSTCTHKAFSYSLKALEALDATLDKHMASRGIDVPQRPSSDTPGIGTLLTLLDAVFFKATACAEDRTTTWITALRQRVGRLAHVFAGRKGPSGTWVRT